MRVLLIDIDTLRPDHMGCYGYHRDTTPNLDRIAQEGVRFDQCYCSDAPCLPSRAALVSGMFGIRNGAVGHGGTAADMRASGASRGFRDARDGGNLWNTFRRAGFHTVSVSTFAERHSSYWFLAGFHEVYNVGKGGMESGEEVVPVALDWLARRGQADRWLMHLHLWDPHTPYRTPADFENPFAGDAGACDWITPEVFARHRAQVGPHGLNELNMYNSASNPDYPKYPGQVERYQDLRALLDGYDMGIRYADMLLGQVLDELRALGVYEDTAIIVTSDHGENMGELGIYGEHGTADQPTCRIPLLVKWPGCANGHVDKAFRYQLDLAPTVAELLGVAPNPEWDGESWARALAGEEAPARDHLILSQMAHVCQRSARFGDWLYVRTLHDGFRLFDGEMLFDLARDPYEQRDVKEEHPEACARGAKFILDWQEAQLGKRPGLSDPMWTVLAEGGPYHARGMLDEYLARLRETGRTAGADALARRHAREKPPAR